MFPKSGHFVSKIQSWEHINSIPILPEGFFFWLEATFAWLSLPTLRFINTAEQYPLESCTCTGPSNFIKLHAFKVYGVKVKGKKLAKWNSEKFNHTWYFDSLLTTGFDTKVSRNTNGIWCSLLSLKLSLVSKKTTQTQRTNIGIGECSKQICTLHTCLHSTIALHVSNYICMENKLCGHWQLPFFLRDGNAMWPGSLCLIAVLKSIEHRPWISARPHQVNGNMYTVYMYSII